MTTKTALASAITLACVSITASAQQSTQPNAPTAESGPPSWPVSGIWMPADAKDAGKLTGRSWLSGVKVRGWVDAYYVSNRNHPDRVTVDANQGSSVVKGKNISVEGRTFDVQDHKLSHTLAEIEIEKIPSLGGFGFKLDLAAGETQNIMLDTIHDSRFTVHWDPLRPRAKSTASGVAYSMRPSATSRRSAAGCVWI
jgi:hypothetical protein